MPNIKNIKTKIESASNMKQLCHNAETLDFEKLERTTEKISCYKSFMEDFLSIVWSANYNFSDTDISNNVKKLILVFSTDKGFCWNYNEKLFKKIYSEYKNEKNNVDVFCIWRKSFEFFAKKWFNVVWYLKLSDEFTQDDLSEIYEYFLLSISNKSYGDISVYLNSLKSKKCRTVNYNLYPVDKSSLHIFMDNLWINTKNIQIVDGLSLWNDYKKIWLEIQKQLLQYMLYGAALQNKKTELTSRISVLQEIKMSSDFIVKDLKLSFNRVCQSLLTKEITNIMQLKPTY